MSKYSFDSLITKTLERLDNEIGDEEIRLSKLKEKMKPKEWAAKRLGLTKHLYNLKESRQVIMLKSVFPNRTFYAQAAYSSFELPDGTLIPIKEKRISDVIEIFADQVQPHELKTPNTVLKSISGGLVKNTVLEVDFKDSAYIKKQIENERAIIKEAIRLKAKIVIVCHDPLHGSSIAIKVNPKNLNISSIVVYGKVPDKLLGDNVTALLSSPKRNFVSVAEADETGIEKPKTSKLSAVEHLKRANGTLDGKPLAEQRGTRFDLTESSNAKVAADPTKTPDVNKVNPTTNSEVKVSPDIEIAKSRISTNVTPNNPPPVKQGFKAAFASPKLKAHLKFGAGILLDIGVGFLISAGEQGAMEDGWKKIEPELQEM